MSTKTLPVGSPSAGIPALQTGDRLTRDEFERRYAAMPNVKKAELVEGVVYMPSPVSDSGHANPQFRLVTWLGLYEAKTPGVRGGDNATLRLDSDNELQPDAFLRILPEYGGQTRTSESEDFVEGAPELVAEVSASSASYDLHDKMNAYRRNGVREYIVWRVWDSELDWFVLEKGRYERARISSKRMHQSQVLPGLWLDPSALIAGDMVRVLDVAQQGTSSKEHAAFLRRLSHRQARSK